MDPKKEQGNPVGMGDSQTFEDIESAKAGSKAFFEGLENQVNGGIQDAEVTQSQQSDPMQVTRNTQDSGSENVAEQSNNGTDWQKRYTDSSREAVKWRDKFKQVEKFTPILQAMKNDSGLVDHVRDYLTGGGKPAKSVQEKLGLDEDFIFDANEAMQDPESDSAKVMNAHVDGLVNRRVGEVVQTEQKRAIALQQVRKKVEQEKDFKARTGMSDEDYAAFKEKAKGHIMTLDDVHYLLNRDKAAQNVATNTKQEMMNQMKSVRNMPTSASGANSQGGQVSEERSVFDNILGFDDSVDNLFG